MISFVYPMPVGNALRISLQPPPSALYWKLLRKPTDDISGVSDADATIILDAGRNSVITDTAGLINGVTMYYMAFYWIGGAWVASASKGGTPNATFFDNSVDPMTVVRDRLELGLAVFVNRGEITNERGFIPVMTASPQVEEVPLPLVTIHLAADAPDMRSVGEMIANEGVPAGATDWHVLEGGFSKADLTIVAWCLNADERIAMRNCIKAVLMANLSVFEAEGLMLISWNFSDSEDFTSYAAPMYQSFCQFTCFAPSASESAEPIITDVTSRLIY